jgi:hypothetical protein
VSPRAPARTIVRIATAVDRERILQPTVRGAYRSCQWADVAQLAERLTCNQQVAGSTPAVGFGEVPEWPKGADCKSAGVCLRRFESSPLHQQLRGNSSVGRAPAFQAGGRGFESRFPLTGMPLPPNHQGSAGAAQVAQSAEHVLGKDEVGGSIPLLGSLT